MSHTTSQMRLVNFLLTFQRMYVRSPVTIDDSRLSGMLNDLHLALDG